MRMNSQEHHMDKQALNALEIRKKIVEVLHRTGGGHYGGAFSVVDILIVLCENYLNLKDRQYSDLIYNRLILSKGHAVIAFYCILASLGLIATDKLYNYGNFMSNLEGHPDMLDMKEIDFSTGSLGQGISVGLGIAIGLSNNSLGKDKHVWVVVGDGECQEGQIWEAALLAARYDIGNLHVIVDANGAQEFGYKYNLELQQDPVPNLQNKWESFGWHTQVVNGHDYTELSDAFRNAIDSKNAPSVIIANTKKGYGVSLFERNPETYHCANLTDVEYNLIMEEMDSYA